ncbi:MAG: hypothetical protein HYX40_12495 [Sphingobacteriales bacterium]|nr:hypothetical protein [Sphingobacteriales bacterium]
MNYMKRLLLLFFFNLAITQFLYSQICVVTVPALKGKYFGDCKKGKAHGYGTAQGIDHYAGDFKKGFPDGKGKYTWKNGDWYDGSWKDGLYDGEGTLNKADTTKKNGTIVLKGFWKKGKYIGETLPYNIQSTSANIAKVKISKQDSIGSQITISVETVQDGAAALGYTTKSKLISVENLAGQYLQKSEYGSTNRTMNKFGLTGVKFPYKAILSFETQGTLIKHVDTMCFGINEKGNWLIEITITN